MTETWELLLLVKHFVLEILLLYKYYYKYKFSMIRKLWDVNCCLLDLAYFRIFIYF